MKYYVRGVRRGESCQALLLVQTKGKFLSGFSTINVNPCEVGFTKEITGVEDIGDEESGRAHNEMCLSIHLNLLLAEKTSDKFIE